MTAVSPPPEVNKFRFSFLVIYYIENLVSFNNLPIVQTKVSAKRANMLKYKFHCNACWMNSAPEYKLTDILVKMYKIMERMAKYIRIL